MRHLSTFALTTALLPLILQPPTQAAGDCSPELIPLIDLRTGDYQCFEGGLYPGATNQPPLAHRQASILEAQSVRPRDTSGNLDPVNGRIAMISIGMSNSSQEFAHFERAEDADPFRNPQLSIVDTAQGGQAANIIRDPAAPYWNIVQDRITAMGMTNAQVQVAWLKESITGEPPEAFPDHALDLEAMLFDIARNLRSLFPNLRICYLSSRIYAGYSNPAPREPRAYETAFSVKWLIADQIGGNPDLNWDPGQGSIEAPLLLWGPYLWADGLTPRSDGLTWDPADFEDDGTHPGPIAEQKVATMLTAFLADDPSAAPWFRGRGRRSVVAVDAEADAYVDQQQPDANFGATTSLAVQGPPGGARHAYLRFDLRGLPRPVFHAELSFRVPTDSGSGANTVWETASVWDELGPTGITWATAPPGTTFAAMIPSASRDNAHAADVTTIVNGDPDGVVSFVLTATSNGQGALEARESGEAPRLVLSLDPPGVPYCFCDGSQAPPICANPGGVGQGCANSTGAGTRLDSGGRASLTSDTLTLSATSLPAATIGILFAGDSEPAGTPFNDGQLCSSGNVVRLGFRVATPDGSATWGPGLGAIGNWLPGDVRGFQAWYRNPAGPCGTGSNTSNGVRVPFAP